MRKSNLFTLGMCSAVAAVAVAGSANAGIPTGVALFDFTTGVSANSSGSVNGSNPFNGWGTDNAVKATTTSATSSGGAITIANQLSNTGGAPTGVFYVSATTPVNLSGTTAIVFNVTAYSGAATDWMLTLQDSNFTFRDLFLVNTSGTGMKSFDTSGLSPGFDWSSVTLVELQAKTRGSLGNRAASSFTFNGMTAVGAVPAPGAFALLGAAGLVGARRRKA
jgi:MYXO-CTERM domain-containing protein